MMAWLKHVVERIIPYDVQSLDDGKVQALERRLAAIDAQADQRRFIIDEERARDKDQPDREDRHVG